MKFLSPWVGFMAVLCLLLTLLPARLPAQSKATCTFQQFTLANSITKDDFALGINSYATVVGAFENTNNTEDGFIRYSGGHLNFFAPNAPTAFTARNDLGNSVGVEYITPNPQGFLLHGSSGVTQIIHPKAVNGTFVQGINKFNSVVGYYLDANNVAHGFKWFPNGSFQDVEHPNATNTTPMGINDSGVIAGIYTDASGTHGFIFSGGKWTTVEYPNVAVGTTSLMGISDNGTAIGVNVAQQPKFTSFLYKNGVFKIISDPNAAGGTFVNGTAANGLITGEVYITSQQSSQQGFIASCQ